MKPTAELINGFLARDFPQVPARVEQVGDGRARMRWPVGDGDLRPGGTISGPTLFAVADLALYIAVLGAVGLVPLAVTTNMNINFLRKPAAGRDLVGECRLVKTGRTLAVGEVLVYSDGCDQPVAQASGTYSIPPERKTP